MSVRFGALTCCCVALMTTPSYAQDAPTAPPEETGHRSVARPKADPGRQTGNASFYAHHFSGRKTASGQLYDPDALTAAHRTLPMGTRLRVTNPKNDRSVIVTVNDRGRLPKGRVVDVSSAAADELDMKRNGVTKVKTQVVTQVEAHGVDKAGTPPNADTTADAPR